jgi:hypothetical protein
VQFYFARLHEISGKRQEAEKVYRQLLQITSHEKILSQARQDLQRLENIKQEERQEAIAKPLAQPSNNEAGIFSFRTHK